MSLVRDVRVGEQHVIPRNAVSYAMGTGFARRNRQNARRNFKDAEESSSWAADNFIALPYRFILRRKFDDPLSYPFRGSVNKFHPITSLFRIEEDRRNIHLFTSWLEWIVNKFQRIVLIFHGKIKKNILYTAHNFPAVTGEERIEGGWHDICRAEQTNQPDPTWTNIATGKKKHRLHSSFERKQRAARIWCRCKRPTIGLARISRFRFENTVVKQCGIGKVCHLGGSAPPSSDRARLSVMKPLYARTCMHSYAPRVRNIRKQYSPSAGRDNLRILCVPLIKLTRRYSQIFRAI